MAFIDARTLPNATRIEADLIIIGAGMAGIAIATEWANAGKTVAMLESGGREIDMEIQALYAGTGTMRAPGCEDRPINEYLIQSRVRALGGSGNVWGGKCGPLDPSDFAERPWLSRSGWPMTRSDLQPFYDRACALLHIPAFHRDFDREPLADRPALPIDENFFSSPREYSRISGRTDREAFDRFRTDFANAPNISVYLNANVASIRTDRRGRRVQGLDVACLNGSSHSARGRAYVLAAGGIENVRILLHSKDARANGLGNHSDWLGRCFQGHVTFGVYENAEGLNTALCVTTQQNMSLYTDGRGPHCVLATTLEGQRRFGTGNFTTTLVNGDTPPGAADPAVLALAGQLDGASAQLIPCFFMAEQSPHLESRLTLHEGYTDALGMAHMHLDWVYSEEDMRNLERSVAALGDALGAAGKGRVRWPVERSQLLAILNQSRHHMGTTRMSVDPDQGVVDADCRVHGVANLYIAGSSVFPTSGIINPTLTLMALAMRLSDHLKQELRA